MLALLLIPAPLSRGFGIGLTGQRMDPAVLPLYLGGGALAGLAFTTTLVRCRTRRARAP